MNSSRHIIQAAVLTCYLIAGIFGPCVILGTLTDTGNGNHRLAPSDGWNDYNPRVIAARRHLVSEKRFDILCHREPARQIITPDLTSVYREPEMVPATIRILQSSSQRPRDPPLSA